MTKILQQYDDDSKHRIYSSNQIIQNDTCNAYADGTVIYTGKDDEGCTVIVQTGSDLCTMYKGLNDCNYSVGDILSTGDSIGSLNSNNTYGVSVLTKVSSHYPVHINNDTWYKHDPTDVIENGYTGYWWDNDTVVNSVNAVNLTNFNDWGSQKGLD